MNKVDLKETENPVELVLNKDQLQSHMEKAELFAIGIHPFSAKTPFLLMHQDLSRLSNDLEESGSDTVITTNPQIIAYCS